MKKIVSLLLVAMMLLSGAALAEDKVELTAFQYSLESQNPVDFNEMWFFQEIEAKTGIPTMKGNPWQSVRTTPAQQQALMPVASEFAVVIGLSERSND